MKKPQLIFNVFFVVAIAIIFVLLIKGRCDSCNTKKEIKGNLSIAYVNSDSLWEKYEFVKKNRAELDSFKAALQITFNQKQVAFEKAQTDAEAKDKKGLFSAIERQKVSAQLAQQNQELMILNQELTNKLSQKTQDMEIMVQDTIIATLKRYNRDKKYTYILQYVKGSSVLVADDTLDITNEVIKLLNKNYEKFKK